MVVPIHAVVGASRCPDICITSISFLKFPDSSEYLPCARMDARFWPIGRTFRRASSSRSTIPDLPSLQVVQEKLGLKLEGTTAPVKVVVIDAIVTIDSSPSYY